MLNFRIAGDSWIRLESPRSDGTFILGNGDGGCSCGAVRGFIYVAPEESVETSTLYRLGWFLPCVLLRFVSGMDLS